LYWSGLQKWSKGKEKVNNVLLFDQATYDKLISKQLRFRLTNIFVALHVLYVSVRGLIVETSMPCISFPWCSLFGVMEFLL
jgi:hypothetical protein